MNSGQKQPWLTATLADIKLKLQKIRGRKFLSAQRGELQNLSKIILKCPICGDRIKSSLVEAIDNLRETLFCQSCSALKRHIDLAESLLKVYNLPLSSSLHESLDAFRNLVIYELADRGPINKIFSTLPFYVCSEYYDDIKPGALHSSGIRCEDVQALTFKNETFDLIITQDVFEHVPFPEQGLREIFRVLKPGGRHIFTVPFHRDTLKSVTRAVSENGKVRFLLDPVFHGDNLRSEGILVFTDFGRDLTELLKYVGFVVELYEKHNPEYAGGYNEIFITTKVT